MNKSIFIKSAVFLLTLSIVISCSIEKRIHQKGYFINKKSNYTSKAVNEQDNTLRPGLKKINENLTLADLELKKTKDTKAFHSIENLKIRSDFEKIKSKNEKLNNNDFCDIIVLKNGREIEAIIDKIDREQIKYRLCEEGEAYGVFISENIGGIEIVEYANGTKWKPQAFMQDSSTSSHKGGFNNEDEDILIAVILWFFLGILGIHRFYLGHYGMGILYLFTGALCGIGWIIDGILFIFGGLKRKNK